ncbi:MAG TPA: hypothetical protein VM734_00275 [Kofleriaceae bacterium]|jgi:hypothetical protein|nr:hypothetical protein [Kofleriaceae bacterium]
MTRAEFEAIDRALNKKGFRLDDPLPHECAKCKERSVAVYMLRGGRYGGRDIEVCQHCGDARSWRRRQIGEVREEDTTFDLATFLA